MTLVQDMLRATAAAGPDRPALIDGDRRLSWGDIDRLSDRLAAALQRLGVGHGDRVGILMPNCAEVVIAIFGIAKAGGVIVVINPASRVERAAFLTRDAGIGTVIASTEGQRLLADVRRTGTPLRSVVWAGTPSARDPGDMSMAEATAHAAIPRPVNQTDHDTCTIVYTSGTTGEPKGVMQTHRNVCSTALANTTFLRNTPDDIISCVLPLAFSYGLCQIFGAALNGHCLLIERSFTFPFDVLKRIELHRATGFPALPTIYARLIQMAPFAGIDLSSLRYMTNAAAPLPAAHVRHIRELFPNVAFYSMYGQTECIRATYLDPGLIDAHPDSSGKAIPGCEATVIDDRGEPAPPGAVGELVIKGPNVMKGYWNRPEATAQKIRETGTPGIRLLHTGDLFRADHEGLLYFVGRTDDVFKVRGEKVSPREIENALCELPEVAEAAALGIDDPVDGQAVKLVLVLREGMTLPEQRIRQHCKARLEAIMMPKVIEIRSSLPKTDAGKLNRIALRGAGA